MLNRRAANPGAELSREMFRGRASLFGHAGYREVMLWETTFDDLDTSADKRCAGLVVGQIKQDVWRGTIDQRCDGVGIGLIQRRQERCATDWLFQEVCGSQ